MNIYVGNISYNLTEDQLKDLFTPFGSVESARIITDKFSGKAKGYAFIEMQSEEEGDKAIEALNGSDVEGRKIIVNKARPKESSPRSGGSGTGRPRYGNDNGGGSRGGNGGGGFFNNRY